MQIKIKGHNINFYSTGILFFFVLFFAGTKVGIAGISGKDYKVTLTRERDHHGIKFVRISVPELGYGMMKKKFWKKNRTTLIEQLVANLHDAGCSLIIGENSKKKIIFQFFFVFLSRKYPK